VIRLAGGDGSAGGDWAASRIGQSVAATAMTRANRRRVERFIMITALL
jgi:hypothetical protein